jgi:Zn-dependent protease
MVDIQVLFSTNKLCKLRGEKMKWSWKIGKIAGIDLKIHLTFFFLVIWIGLSTLINGGSSAAALTEILFILALFLCVVLHEFGHALAARIFGITTRDITLLPIGGLARLETMPEDPKEELIVAAAGPAVNVVIAVLLFGALLASGTFSQPLSMAVLMNNFWLRLLTVNLSLVIFNLIPAFPMDGGRVLRSLLASGMEYVKATRIAANVGRGLAVMMGIAGFFLNPFLVLIAIFIWYGAGAEAQSVEIKASLRGVYVQDALVTQFYQVEANQTLGQVFQVIMSTGQSYVPVVSNGAFLGIIRRIDLMKSLERLGDRAPAYAAIGLEPEGISLDKPLVDILPKLNNSRVLPVLDGRSLVGLVTTESVQQCLWINKHRRQNGPQPPEENVTRI